MSDLRLYAGKLLRLYAGKLPRHFWLRAFVTEHVLSTFRIVQPRRCRIVLGFESVISYNNSGSHTNCLFLLKQKLFWLTSYRQKD